MNPAQTQQNTNDLVYRFLHDTGATSKTADRQALINVVAAQQHVSKAQAANTVDGYTQQAEAGAASGAGRLCNSAAKSERSGRCDRRGSDESRDFGFLSPSLRCYCGRSRWLAKHAQSLGRIKRGAHDCNARRRSPRVKKYVAEFIGTFVLVFGGVGSAVLRRPEDRQRRCRARIWSRASRDGVRDWPDLRLPCQPSGNAGSLLGEETSRSGRRRLLDRAVPGRDRRCGSLAYDCQRGTERIRGRRIGFRRERFLGLTHPPATAYSRHFFAK